ncbi:unnamed protein product [Moneuplotes crassus]|uniref:Uncharacterized protein n=1 Tax=Euplotes crassus TaxID=5936 RepID=A0AAD1UPH3_EUPCR|nr:unnamed protein product [Moneuplotes crassus]
MGKLTLLSEVWLKTPSSNFYLLLLNFLTLFRETVRFLLLDTVLLLCNFRFFEFFLKIPLFCSSTCGSMGLKKLGVLIFRTIFKPVGPLFCIVSCFCKSSKNPSTSLNFILPLFLTKGFALVLLLMFLLEILKLGELSSEIFISQFSSISSIYSESSKWSLLEVLAFLGENLDISIKSRLIFI